MPNATPRRATILVFGDLGRSPRMLNHAAAMAASGWQVALVGYLDSPVSPQIADNPRIRLHPIRTLQRCPDTAPRIVFLLWTAVRLAWAQPQAAWILTTTTPRPTVVLAQNPPTVPTLFVGRIASRLRGARFVIDWHNYGYSMLALRMGPDSRVIRLMKHYEAAAGRRADAHLCVSEAMSSNLEADFGIAAARVLYDRPMSLDAPLDRSERLATMQALFPVDGVAADTLTLHCPTSWTDDEDVDVLLDAVLQFEQSNPTRLFVIITGRGPRREAFEARLAATALAHSKVRTAFLSPADYRRLLAAADCGVSLHRSSSGVDLPMKLVDFFGAGTPALALDYGACLAEQVQDGREALLFSGADELAARMDEITEPQRLEALRAGVRPAWSESWIEAWNRAALPLMDESS